MKKSFCKKAVNRILHILARFLPGCTTVRPFLHRYRGVKVGRNVFIGDDVYLESEYPECIEIGDEVQIILRATVIAHFREGHGRVVIEKKARIGPNTVIAGSSGETLVIGEAAVLAAGAVVTKNVEPYTLVAGVPAKPIARVTTPCTAKYTYKEFKDGLIFLKDKKDN